jgi:hypothetical protein
MEIKASSPAEAVPLSSNLYASAIFKTLIIQGFLRFWGIGNNPWDHPWECFVSALPILLAWSVSPRLQLNWLHPILTSTKKPAEASSSLATER